MLELHPGSSLLKNLCLLARLLDNTIGRIVELPGHNAEEFCLVFVSVVIGRSNADQLFKLPPVGHSGHHLCELFLLALQDSVHMLHRSLRGSVLVVPYPLLHQPHERCNVVKLSFFQYPFLCKLLVYDELPVSEVVQYWTKIGGVSIDEIRPCLILWKRDG